MLNFVFKRLTFCFKQYVKIHNETIQVSSKLSYAVRTHI